METNPLILLLQILACSNVPSDSLRYRNHWEVLGVTDHYGLIDTRITLGNTDLFRQQGQIQFDHWPQNESATRHSRLVFRDQLSVDEELHQTSLGPDHFRIDPELNAFQMSIKSTQLKASLYVQNGGPQVQTTTWEGNTGQWTTDIAVADGKIQGWIHAGRQGGPIDGRAVVIHREGNAIPPLMANGRARQDLYLFGQKMSLGLTIEGPIQSAWLQIDGADLDASAAQSTQLSDTEWKLDFRPNADVVATISSLHFDGETNIRDRYLFVERLLLRLWRPDPVRTVAAVRGTVMSDGEETPIWGVSLVVGSVLLDANQED